MEKLKIKHDHKLTDILKVGIFCLFLILPILLFLPNCLYYGFNEHATNTETTTINYKYQSNEVNTQDDLVEGNIYHFELQNDNLDTYWLMPEGYVFDMLFINIDSYNFSYFAQDFEIDEKIGQTYENNGFMAFNITIGTNLEATYYYYLTFNENNDYLFSFINSTYWDTGSITLIGDFIYLGGSFNLRNGHTINELITETDYNVIESVEVNTDNTITTQIGNSWASLWQTPFLQWTDNNNFQFTINAFTNVFGITQESYITNYLNYILTMTCIYLVFDIVISISTKLTHMLTNSKD